jgi:DNA-binding response OmpR family regulator
MKILLIEDNKSLVKSLKKGIEEEGFAVDTALDGEEGLFLATTVPYDVIILDLMLPKLDGITLLKQVRKQGIHTHVIILTARDAPEDIIQGLNEGSDDYLTKPFHFKELIARIRALVRRKYYIKSPLIEVGNIKIDTGSRRVWYKSDEVLLQPKEFALLECLIYHKNQIVSRTTLWEHLYDWQSESTSNVLDVLINHLRKKIDRDPEERIIITVRGEGYMLKDGL